MKKKKKNWQSDSCHGEELFVPQSLVRHWWYALPTDLPLTHPSDAEPSSPLQPRQRSIGHLLAWILRGERKEEEEEEGRRGGRRREDTSTDPCQPQLGFPLCQLPFVPARLDCCCRGGKAFPSTLCHFTFPFLSFTNFNFLPFPFLRLRVPQWPPKGPLLRKPAHLSAWRWRARMMARITPT